MKIKHIKHNACRLLSLLLVVAALSGLLTIGAWADGGLTISVDNVVRDGDTVTADVLVTGSASIAAGEFTVNVPDGLTLTGIKGNAFGSKNLTGIDGLNVAYNVERKYFGFFVNIADEDVSPWNPNDGITKLATLTFTVSEGAFGDLNIGLSGVTLGSDGAGDGGSVSVSGTYSVSVADATLSLPKVTLTFISSKGMAPAAQDLPQGGKATEPADPEVPGYELEGWYANEVCTTPFDFDQPLNENSWAYAKWTPKNYTVTFDEMGGALPEGTANTKSVTYDSAYGALPTPTREGYKFGGWYLGETQITDTSTVTTADDHTLVAKWTEKAQIGFDVTPQEFECGGTIGYVPRPLVFEGTAPTEGYTVYYIVAGVETTTPPTAIGSYSVRITRAEDDTYQKVNQTIEPALVITKKLVTEPTQGESQWIYDGTVRSFTYTADDDSAYTVTADSASAGTNAGTYTITFQLKDKANYQWKTTGNSDDLVFTYTIHKAELSKPSLTQDSFEYDGTAKTVTLTPLDNKYELVASTATATDAGIHEAKVVIKEAFRGNYKWADEDAAVYEIELPYAIGAKIVAAPTADSTSFVYDGTEQTYGITATDDYSVENNTQKDAGTYTVTVSLKDKTNTAWADGTTDDLTFTFTIAPKPVTAPTEGSGTYTYNASQQTYAFGSAGDEADYTVTGNTQKDAGNYTVTVSLKDKTNTAWADGTTDDLTFTFTIAPKPVTAPTEGSGTYTYNASQQTYAFGSAGDEADYTVTGNTQKDAGTYTVTVSLKDKTNTAWADGTTDDLTFTFTIAKADQAAPTGVTAENESIFKKGDGKITGVDKTMEYSADDGKTWTKISGNKLENLKPGEYKVRYAETDNCNASPDASVTVGEGTKLKASFNTGAGSDVADQTNLGYGDALTKPEATYDGFTLVGWFKENSYKHAWDFATDRMGDEDITLYAKWELSIGIEGDARFTEGKAPAEGVKIIVGKGLDQTADTKTIELQKVTVDGKKLDAENYTVAYGEDGLTVTLKQEYLNTLADDEYEIGVVVESEHLNGTERKLSVTLTVDPVQGAAGKPAAKPGKAVKTGDSSDLLLWSVLTLGAGAGLVCIGKKRREN